MKTLSIRTLLNSIVAATALLGCVAAQAQVTLYSNVTTFTGQAFAAGGTAAGGGGSITKMAADDLNLLAGSVGRTVNSFTFSVANLNTTTVSARPIVNFYANNGASGGPGTLLASITFNAVSVAASTVSLFTFSPGSTIFTIPSSTIWAGMMFDNGGTSTATATQLNNFAQGIFDPPTVGSSGDQFFLSTNAGPTGSNPAGTFSFFGGNPHANFGWALSGPALAAVPETGSTMLMLMVGVAGIVTLQRRFRVNRS